MFVSIAQLFYGQEKYTIQGEFPDNSRCSIYTPLIIRIFLLNRYNLCFDKYTECRDNANRCISQLCIYVLYRLLSVLLWNVRYQIQRVER